MSCMRVFFFFNRNINPPPVSNISTSFKLLFRMALIIDSFMFTGSVAFPCSTPEAFSRAWRPNGRPNTAPQLPGCLLFKPSGKRVGSFFLQNAQLVSRDAHCGLWESDVFLSLAPHGFSSAKMLVLFHFPRALTNAECGKGEEAYWDLFFSRSSHKNAGVLCSRVCSQISDGEIIFGEEITVYE